MIKKTTQKIRTRLYRPIKDNVAFAEGPVIEQFAPGRPPKPDFFQIKDIKSVISLKAETHNFPTTVEPFNGASTGTAVKSATVWAAVKAHGLLPEQPYT